MAATEPLPGKKDSMGGRSSAPKPPQQGIVWVLRVLLIFVSIYTLHFAKSLLMPIVVALLFSLLLSPLVALFKRFSVPRPLSAILLIAMLGGPFVVLSIELAEPAKKWMERVPELSAEVTKELDAIGDKLSSDPETVAPEPEPEESGLSAFFSWFKSDNVPEVEARVEPENDSALVEGVKKGGVEVLVSILAATPSIIAQFVIWVILVLFLLIFGPGLYSNFIELFPQVRDKRRAEVLVGRVRQELSRYILAVSAINTALGIVTGSVLWFMGVDDALLWGVLVGLLNFAPYVGPVIAMCMLGFAGVVQYGLELASLVPAMTYFAINLIEAQFITPTVLGRHMRLNPLVLMIWLLIWGWLWGPVGVLLAVPLLVCIKLTASQLDVAGYWVQLVETRA